MNPTRTQHEDATLRDDTFSRELTDEQMAVLLAAAPANDTTFEADAEVRAMQAALRSYRTETLLWAERRSAGQPSLAPLVARNRFWTAAPQWALAAIAVVTISVGAFHLRESNNAVNDIPAVQTFAQTSTSSLAEDNRLLSQIDVALQYDSAPPASIQGKSARTVPAVRSIEVTN